ncbi:hypothetical protein CDAR_180611 [Caerostris darwini]|uniref:Uncharacterized protein n=1 Tax=Caerostris darwini TaxID=1538125 RepID=A0AAV4PEZ5_9ARAC|nr:hypothetical protein CDAR_180611 [Caerostris darwini]
MRTPIRNSPLNPDAQSFTALPEQGASLQVTHAVPLCITTSISILEEDVSVIVSGREIPATQGSPTPPPQSLAVALTGNKFPP